LQRRRAPFEAASRRLRMRSNSALQSRLILSNP
jgi:hypothetical protein